MSFTFARSANSVRGRLPSLHSAAMIQQTIPWFLKCKVGSKLYCPAAIWHKAMLLSQERHYIGALSGSLGPLFQEGPTPWA